MSVYYGVIARKDKGKKSTILVATGTATPLRDRDDPFAFAQKALRKVKKDSISKIWEEKGVKVFATCQRSTIIVMILTSMDVSDSVGNGLLTTAYGDFSRMFPPSKIQNAEEMALSHQFNFHFVAIMEKGTEYHDNRFKYMRKDIDETQERMMENLSLLLDRGESIEAVANETDDLSVVGKAFVKTTKIINRKSFWKVIQLKACRIIMIGLILLVILLIIAMLVSAVYGEV